MTAYSTFYECIRRQDFSDDLQNSIIQMKRITMKNLVTINAELIYRPEVTENTSEMEAKWWSKAI